MAGNDAVLVLIAKCMLTVTCALPCLPCLLCLLLPLCLLGPPPPPQVVPFHGTFEDYKKRLRGMARH
jgi:hypothetical protein